MAALSTLHDQIGFVLVSNGLNEVLVLEICQDISELALAAYAPDGISSGCLNPRPCLRSARHRIAGWEGEVVYTVEFETHWARGITILLSAPLIGWIYQSSSPVISWKRLWKRSACQACSAR